MITVGSHVTVPTGHTAIITSIDELASGASYLAKFTARATAPTASGTARYTLGELTDVPLMHLMPPPTPYVHSARFRASSARIDAAALLDGPTILSGILAGHTLTDIADGHPVELVQLALTLAHYAYLIGASDLPEIAAALACGHGYRHTDTCPTCEDE